MSAPAPAQSLRSEGRAGTPDSSDAVAVRWFELDNFGVEVPAGRVGSASASADGTLVAFGGRGGGKLATDQLFQFDPETSRWAPMPGRGFPPCPRWTHSMTSGGDGLIVFGGMGIREEGMRPVYQNDCYRFCLRERQWEAMRLQADPNARELPCSRRGHVACADAHDTLIIHGGVGPDPLFGREVLLSDMHSLDLVARQWHTLRPTGDVPSPRCFHAGAICGRGLLHIFGGWSSTAMLATTRMDAWNLARPQKPPVPGRRGVSDPRLRSTIEQLRRRYPHAGRRPWTQGGRPNARGTALGGSPRAAEAGAELAAPHIFRFDPARQEWARLETAGSTPAPRHGHALHAIGPAHSLLVLVGGVTAHGPSMDVHLFACDTATWHGPLDCGGSAPLPRVLGTSAVVDGRLLLFGGVERGATADSRVHFLRCAELEAYHRQCTGAEAITPGEESGAEEWKAATTKRSTFAEEPRLIRVPSPHILCTPIVSRPRHVDANTLEQSLYEAEALSRARSERAWQYWETMRVSNPGTRRSKGQLSLRETRGK